MAAEIRNCEQCKKDFPVYDEDRVFYDKFKVPEPKMCPGCRAQRRLAFRNERVFYKRPCDKCHKDVVSMYSSNKPYPVWCYECWFAEDWDATTYGQDYDPRWPFLEQVRGLYQKVPKVALIYVRSVNSEYVNISADNKDCYMLVESSNNEGCINSYWVQQCRDSVDLSYSHQTELAYESDDCYNGYRLLYSKGCHDCRDSCFLYDCRGCSDCIGCANLRNQRYCVWNEPLGKEGYEKFLSEARLDTASGVETMRKKFAEFIKTQPRKYAEIVNAPGCSGGYINDAKNCRECFHCYDAEDCAYGEHVWRNAKDCMDVSTAGRGASKIYNSINCGIDVADHIAVAQGWSSTFLEYCFNIFNSNHCFGSAGLRKKDYCILNKQYTKEGYEKLREKIISEMKTRGEYGEFFPATFSPFGYNETVAEEQFPLTKEKAAVIGFGWEEYPRGTYGKETRQWQDIPDSIKDFAATDINKDIFVCLNCKKNYRVIPAELQFYKRLEIPLPRFCPDCRHARRVAARGPNRLFGPQQCRCDNKLYKNTTIHTNHPDGRCANKFQSNYADDSGEILYCEQCYNTEVA
jgi:hypothetical protein